MSVYGNFINENIQEKAMSIIEFSNYIEECDSKIFGMFGNLGILTEAENELVVIKPTSEFESSKDPEKVKKSIIQTIKEMIAKFIATIKKLFNDIADKIHKAYMETNFVDKFVSKFKDKVTYDNLEKAKDKGWKGLRLGVDALVNRVASPKDSKLYREARGDFGENKIDVDKDISEIVRAENLDDAEEKYKLFKRKLNGFKERTSREDAESYVNINNFTAKLSNNSSNLFVGCFGQLMPNDKNYYFPSAENFIKTKQFAENGESNIKQIKSGYKASLDGLNLNKEIELSNWNSFKKGGVNYSEDETSKINALYCKARYEYSTSIIQRGAKVINEVVKVIKMQHKVAITTYTKFVYAINRYVVNE